jgi:CheY-like chemotaxis protein
VGENGRILIVDDNPLNVEILQYIFNKDFELKTAVSGLEALEVVSAFHPDIVLMDAMMPEMDGYEACRRMRAIPDLSGLKIIMVTAKALPEELQKGIEAGADDYVTKPFDHRDLRSKVNALFGLPESPERNPSRPDASNPGNGT